MCLGRVGVSLVLGFAGRWCSFLGLLGVQFVLVVVISKVVELKSRDLGSDRGYRPRRAFGRQHLRARLIGVWALRDRSRGHGAQHAAPLH